MASPTSRTIVDHRVYSGRTAAVESVELRSRVSGYLGQIHFTEGAEVEAGALLFQIDPRPYKHALAQAEANAASMNARLKRLNRDIDRERPLLSSGVTNQVSMDKLLGERDEAAASLQALHAGAARAKLDLEFTRVMSPIKGRVSRAMLTPGNLVVADSSILTRVVSLDPVHVYFDVDEGSALHYRKLVREHRVQSARRSRITVRLALANEQGFPHEGYIDFVDNRSDPRTGNIQLRAVFPNPEQVLLPGLFARVRVPFSSTYSALLVPERALSMDQRGRFVLVVNAEDVIEYRAVTVGTKHEGMVVISQGLTVEDRVVVSGLQRSRPGVRVSPAFEAAGPK